MIGYITNKMLYEWKETVGNIIFDICLMSVMVVCCNIVVRLYEMTKNDWYKNSLEVKSIGDPFIREKMGLLIGVMMALIVILCAFCFIVYALKIRLDIVKERERISIFQIIGYGYLRRCVGVYVGKLIELLIAAVLAGVTAVGIWKYLCKQDTFWEIIALIDKEGEFYWRFVVIVFLVMVLWGLLNTLWIVKRKLKIMDMRGEEK